MAEHLLGVRIDQRLAGAEQLPDLLLLGDLGGVNGVAGAGNHAVALQGHHAGRGIEAVSIQHPRFAEEGLDILRRNGRNTLLHGLDVFAPLLVDCHQFEPRLLAALVQHDDLARVDELRVLDLVGVQLPQLAPTVGVLEELGGDTPQRVAGGNHVPVGGVVRQLRCLRWRYTLCEHQSA